MTAHSPLARLIFDQSTGKIGLEDISVAQQMELRDTNRSKSHSQDADRHARTFHQKSNKK
jgi:hypothetical protein